MCGPPRIGKQPWMMNILAKFVKQYKHRRRFFKKKMVILITKFTQHKLLINSVKLDVIIIS